MTFVTNTIARLTIFKAFSHNTRREALTMGLNHNYLLYFKRERPREALHGVASAADPPPTKIHFPDRSVKLQIATDFQADNEISYDNPEIKFGDTKLFAENEVNRDYLFSIDNDWIHRTPPKEDCGDQVAIGFIYLKAYTDLSEHYAFNKLNDLLLFRFRTTGTRMSLLLNEYVTKVNEFILQSLQPKIAIAPNVNIPLF